MQNLDLVGIVRFDVATIVALVVRRLVVSNVVEERRRVADMPGEEDE